MTQEYRTVTGPVLPGEKTPDVKTKGILGQLRFCQWKRSVTLALAFTRYLEENNSGIMHIWQKVVEKKMKYIKVNIEFLPPKI